MNVVIYARFSSHNQHETSIEGQLKECTEYARRNGYTVIETYIDRAISGTTDNRPEFLRMISDSANKQFKFVLVYQLDRFARSRLDSATYKAILKRNGVKVLSVRENISDDASGVLMEAVLEGMAEYYSVELSQKIKRGMTLNAEKCLYTGGGVPLGYKVNPDKTFAIDETTAFYVQKIYEMYANGSTVAQINAYLNSQQVRTKSGGAFNKNSLHQILKNKRYIGYYTFNDMEIENGIPRILSDDLFYKVQALMKLNKKAPARLRNDDEYILTTKLFCGHCREMMTGYSGTSKLGKIYRYYSCNNARKKLCDKRNIGKDYIENLVIAKCRELLTDTNIELIAKEVVKVSERDQEHSNARRLEKLIKDNEKAVDNLLKALETGAAAEQITARIQEKNAERIELEKQLAAENTMLVGITVPQVKFFLTQIRNGDANDIKYRKVLVTTLVNKIYLYDDKITMIFNAGNQPVEITEELLNDIEAAGDGVHSLTTVHHQNKITRTLYFFCGGFSATFGL